MSGGGLRTVALYATGTHPCSYLPGKWARTLFVDPQRPPSNLLYSALIRQGFRRSGSYIYRPGCQGCTACKSLRIPVADYQYVRRDRRCLAANRDLTSHALAAEYRAEHFALYARYIASRHAGGDMDNPTPAQYREFLIAPWADTAFYEFRRGTQLMAVGVIDRVSDGLSAVYSFYDPQLRKRGLGRYVVLRLIEATRQLQLPYLYLGYWIEECPKMTYKSTFRPHEIYDGAEWRLSRGD